MSLPYREADCQELSMALAADFERSHAGSLLIFNGECPRCEHQFQAEVDVAARPVVVGRGLTGMTTSELATAPIEHLVLCACRQDHAGRPAEATGCGAMGKIVVKARP